MKRSTSSYFLIAHNLSRLPAAVAFVLTNLDSLLSPLFLALILFCLSQIWQKDAIDLHEVLIHIVSPPAVPALSGDWRRTDD